MSAPTVIFDDFESKSVSSQRIDELLANGWRHAGEHFYRYNFAFHQGMLTEVIPLRIQLGQFQPSKSQRKIWRRNQNKDYHIEIRPTVVDDEKNALFQQHKSKFVDNVPDQLHDFLAHEPHAVPCEGREVAVYHQDQLIGTSFFDVGEQSISTIYGMYDLEYGKQGLGIYTMMLEMEHAKALGKPYYYHGYCYRCPSFYDYKKRFTGLEAFDWEGNWRPWEENDSEPQITA